MKSWASRCLYWLGWRMYSFAGWLQEKAWDLRVVKAPPVGKLKKIDWNEVYQTVEEHNDSIPAHVVTWARNRGKP